MVSLEVEILLVYWFLEFWEIFFFYLLVWFLFYEVGVVIIFILELKNWKMERIYKIIVKVGFLKFI